MTIFFPLSRLANYLLVAKQAGIVDVNGPEPDGTVTLLQIHHGNVTPIDTNPT